MRRKKSGKSGITTVFKKILYFFLKPFNNLLIKIKVKFFLSLFKDHQPLPCNKIHLLYYQNSITEDFYRVLRGFTIQNTNMVQVQNIKTKEIKNIRASIFYAIYQEIDEETSTNLALYYSTVFGDPHLFDKVSNDGS